MSNPYVIGVLMKVDEQVGESYLDKKLAGELRVETRILNDDEIYAVGTRSFEVATRVYAETNVALEELRESKFLEDMLKANGNNEGTYYLYLMNMLISDKALEYEYTEEVEVTEEDKEAYYKGKAVDNDEIDIDEMAELYNEGSQSTETGVRTKEVVIEDYNIVDEIMECLLDNTLVEFLDGEEEEVQLISFDLLEIKY